MPADSPSAERKFRVPPQTRARPGVWGTAIVFAPYGIAGLGPVSLWFNVSHSSPDSEALPTAINQGMCVWGTAIVFAPYGIAGAQGPCPSDFKRLLLVSGLGGATNCALGDMIAETHRMVYGAYQIRRRYPLRICSPRKCLGSWQKGYQKDNDLEEMGDRAFRLPGWMFN
ncbi:hypothetical protein BJV78DRAFT_1352014 [Lactifluus subvellereus]|nr:hypothetical protein BJV78DRAFT_1352014 [Lactifluus subvellereus]